MLDVAKALGVAIDGNLALFVVLVELVIHSEVNQFEYQVIHTHAVFHLESKDCLVVEEEAERALGTQVAVELVEHRTYISHGAGGVVGE